MREFIFKNIGHCLAFLILIARVADIGSTFLATPKLRLEANPLFRKFGRRKLGLCVFVVLNLFLCAAPYIAPGIGIMVLVPSLLVSASNTAKIWRVRSYGEDAYYELLLGMARAGNLAHAMASEIVSGLFMALAGGVLLILNPRPVEDAGFWFAVGILLYAFVSIVYGCLYTRRLFRQARQDGKGTAPVG